jgi:hypothetical protein
MELYITEVKLYTNYLGVILNKLGEMAESGRRRPTRNRVGCDERPRGFESHSLRHF